MAVAALCARFLLAGVLAWSGTAKLRDREGSRQAVRDFGVGDGLSKVVAPVLAPLELLAAALLILGGVAGFVGGLLAVALLGSFTVGIVVNLLLGRHPDCHCFGRASTAPLSWWSVARNAVLLGLTAPVLAAGQDQPWLFGALGDRTDAELAAGLSIAALALAVAVLGYLLLEGLRRHGALLLRVEQLERLAGIAPAPPAPDLALVDLGGGEHTVGGLVAERAALLVFTSANCGPCAALAPDIAAWADRAAVRVAIIGAGSPDQVREKFSSTDSLTVLLDPGGAQKSYGVSATPAAVLVDQSLRIAAGPAYGADEIRALVGPYLPVPTGLEIEPRPLGLGDPAPHAHLVDEDGDEVEVSDVADDRVLLFWDPTCGFASRILPDVMAWEAAHDGEAPLVVATRGDAASVRESGLLSRVVLDPAFRAGTAFGAPGTPSAVIVRDGRLASAVAIGGPEVVALLATRSASTSAAHR
ncbi:MAG TPA: MauE/DoxX family redox-associated membrane protein [Mycobacteriales bacterium]|nr:MauE/DoxX family redox-associated membrane protein [Mycobacteriales bacterium]